jgi:hypothetical protein
MVGLFLMQAFASHAYQSKVEVNLFNRLRKLIHKILMLQGRMNFLMN